jgi:hypothetical protein
VTAVDLIANPHRDVERLRTYLVQNPGELYSQANGEPTRNLHRSDLFLFVSFFFLSIPTEVIP